MVPLSWHLAAIQGMRGDQIVARLRLRTRRAIGASSVMRRASRRRVSRTQPISTHHLGLAASVFPAPNTQHPTPSTQHPTPALASAILARASAVAAGRFRFLNEERSWSLPVDWEAAGASRLWRFNLHYFEEAPLLALAGQLTGEPRWQRLFRELAEDWISANHAGSGDGWHPYTLSRRIPNWIYALELGGLSGTPPGQPILVSLYEQARFLAGNLEFDALGNHLLANVRALLFAGCFFDGEEAERWWEQAARILDTELAEQFLADGGHFERSPMYHALVLQDLLECAALFTRRGEIPARLGETIRRAVEWLGRMCHPDGGVALFNDSALEGPTYGELAAFARALLDGSGPDESTGWRQRVWFGGAATKSSAAAAEDPPPNDRAFTALPESGYFILRDAAAGHALFFDAGEPCPSYIPAHAHCDLLSFELSLFGQRVIVDSGVCEYAPGPWRDYCRSTRAHNTVQVDGQEQSEIWGSFRLGPRAHPTDVRCSTAGGTVEVSAAHTGYRRLRGEVLHRRTVSYDGARYRVCDDVTGGGHHRIESFLHFHPSVNVVQRDGTLIVEGQGVHAAVHFGSEVSVEVRRGDETEAPALQGWYCPEFGERQAGTVAVLTWEGTLPTRLEYAIEPQESGEVRHNEESVRRQAGDQ